MNLCETLDLKKQQTGNTEEFNSPLPIRDQLSRQTRQLSTNKTALGDLQRAGAKFSNMLEPNKAKQSSSEYQRFGVEKYEKGFARDTVCRAKTVRVRREGRGTAVLAVFLFGQRQAWALDTTTCPSPPLWRWPHAGSPQADKQLASEERFANREPAVL